MKITTTITLEERHKQWIDDNSINLSKWIRKKLEEEISQDGSAMPPAKTK